MKKGKCVCGERLPTHLLAVSKGMGLTHVCSCERVYEANKKGTKFLLTDRTEKNPFAEKT